MARNHQEIRYYLSQIKYYKKFYYTKILLFLVNSPVTSLNAYGTCPSTELYLISPK